METLGRFSFPVAAAELIPGRYHGGDELVVLPHTPQATFMLAWHSSCLLPHSSRHPSDQARNGLFSTPCGLLGALTSLLNGHICAPRMSFLTEA